MHERTPRPRRDPVLEARRRLRWEITKSNSNPDSVTQAFTQVQRAMLRGKRSEDPASYNALAQFTRGVQATVRLRFGGNDELRGHFEKVQNMCQKAHDDLILESLAA